MKAVVDLIEHGTPGCFRHCGSAARFTVWADWTNADGEYGDVDPLDACDVHLPDACVAKMTED